MREVLKHQAGKHDQRSHGAWAKGSRASAIEQRLTQTPTNDLMAAANYSLDQGIDAMRKHRYVGVDDAVNNGHWPPEKYPEKYRMGTTKFQNQSAIVYDPDGVEGLRISSTEGQKAAREHTVDVMLNVWSVTSNEHSMVLAMQDSVQSEFDLQNVTSATSVTNPRLYSRLPDAKEHEGVFRDVVRAQYEVTQKALTDAGTKHVTVYRGTQAMEVGDIDTADVQLRPASSWTTNIEVAKRFASGTYGDPDGVVMKMTVPASRVLSTPDTGWGVKKESELVILGGEYRAEVASPDYVSWFSKYGELNGLRIRRSS